MMGVNSAGGPVGAAPMMNNSQGGPRGPRQADQSDPGKNLNTYIYDYLLKTHHYEVARVFQKELEINIAEKPSPGRRPNGIDSMDTDSKDDIHKKPADLPEPALPPLNADSNFLFDWWCQFWDIWAAHRGKGNNPNATHYLNHTIVRCPRHVSDGFILTTLANRSSNRECDETWTRARCAALTQP